MAIIGLILAVGFCALLGLFILWCCCYVSGECSRREEKRERPPTPTALTFEERRQQADRMYHVIGEERRDGQPD